MTASATVHYEIKRRLSEPQHPVRHHYTAQTHGLRDETATAYSECTRHTTMGATLADCEGALSALEKMLILT